MNILLFLLNLERTIKKTEKKMDAAAKAPHFIDYKTGKKIDADYASLQKDLASKRKQAPSRPGLGKLLNSAVNNVKNIAVNAFDNTAGYGIAQVQNYQTRRELKKNPDAAKKYMTVHIPGLFQNIGSQWRFARDERKKGRLPYHLHPHNGLPKAERETAARQQLQYLKDKTGKNPYKILSGHSDGAALSVGLAQDQKTVKNHNIIYVQARAPSVHGATEHDTIGKKILMPFAANDNVKKSIYARKGAVENAKKKPYVPVDVVAGEYDGLVTPKDAVYKHARAHYLVRGEDSTHFGTSGVNPKMNKKFSHHIDDLVQEHKSAKQSKVTQMPIPKSYGAKVPYAANDNQKYKKAA